MIVQLERRFKFFRLVLIIIINAEICFSSFGNIRPLAVCQIVAPLSPGFGSDADQLISTVSSFGLTPRISLDIFNVSGPDSELPWYSNSDQFRAQDLAAAILSPSVEVIWFVNGGSGAYRTLEHLIPLLPPPPLTPKPMIGFSASTPIFTFLQQRYNWTEIVHGALLDLIVSGYYENSTAETLEPLRALLFGNEAGELVLPPLTRVDGGMPFDRLEGTVTGGSMRQTVLSNGTPYKLNATGKILFFEISESTADSANDLVDALIYSGTFDGVVAVLFGDFMSDKREPPSFVQWILERLATEISIPIFRISGLGHDTTNFPIPLNTPVTLRHLSGSNYSLTVSF